MKKFVFWVLIISLLIGPLLNVYAEDYSFRKIKNKLIELNIMNEDYFSNSSTVTRKECLIAIMRCIGLTDQIISLFNGADYTAFVDTHPYSYYGCAYRAKIAYGEECMVDYPTYRTSHTGKNTDIFFFPERNVSVKETLAFMVRCLISDELEYDGTIEKAKAYELIYEYDNFVNDENAFISPESFLILINRFVHQGRYKYYDKIEQHYDMNGCIDEERSMTYLEFLSLRP
ncbi:MAG: hypothetical protein E7411_05565 [Ruminococcaceae bacterium]|nr:hypothetical protein [Oscillospiraceae bacterium]